MTRNNRWQFWIDVGGTFTDCFARAPDGTESELKLLSSGISQQHVSILGADCQDVPSPILGIHLLTDTKRTDQLPTCDVHLGTTRGTNALLTRTGSRTALVTSRGMKDFLTIGDQTRPHLFALTVVKPAPLFVDSFEIDERTLFDGTVELIPDPEKIRQQFSALHASGIESVAICLMHGYKFPQHEQMVGEIARQIGFRDVRLSSEVAPLIKIIPRGETTVLDAYLNPVIGEYLDTIQTMLGSDSSLKLMTSAGTLTTRSAFSGKDSVLSGPASGVVGSARVAQQLGYNQSIGFDMGGTSTDVSRFDGEFELEFETTKAGVKIMTPMMAIETVAAGGGSICSFDGTRLVVGPASAGADPGPACYGNEGPLTVTDINLFLGRLDLRRFPFRLDQAAVTSRLEQLAASVATSGQTRTLHELASGFLKIANHNMAAAIRNVSIARGYDPRDYLLVAFGGAGGQHCCAVADCLGITKVLVHPKGSILSAYGIQLADQSRSQAHSILEPLNDQTLEQARTIASDLISQTTTSMIADGCRTEDLKAEISFDLRYLNTDNAINIREPESGGITEEFQRIHKQHFGYTQDRPIELVAVRTTVTQPGQPLESTLESGTRDNSVDCEPEQFQSLFSVDQQCEAAKYQWDAIPSGSIIQGPAIIGDLLTSTIVDTGWQATVMADRQLMLSRRQNDSIADNSPTATAAQTLTDLPPDPVELEIFNCSFRSIADQMGHVLRNTAISVNVKERLDYSCALFSPTGDLVVNAPHIPVHLGAMSETVRSTIADNPNIEPGDVFVTNDPYAGGSHLPDVTVLTPVFHADQNQPMLWVASRAHHAEIGGIAPGSMPASATCLEEEGVLIENFKLISAGKEQFESLQQLLNQAQHPTRNAAENIADIKAQVAANQSGAREFAELVAQKSLPIVVAYMQHIRTAAARKTRAALKDKVQNGEYHFADQMDDGTPIKVALTKQGEQLKVDFTGTGPVHSGNLNANSAIVSSAILYVLRCLIDEDIPLNSGVLEPVEIVLPVCFLNPHPAATRGKSPAVVGGNVETSQRIVDTLLSALGMAAASQGTMNNWLVGDAGFGYYETVGGGSGATVHCGGANAVHCHMSNTRLTDPEILETRYPMILRQFAVRKGSGGAGKHHGGDGMIREIEFRRPLTLSLLTSRRTCSPNGIDGGQDGEVGKNLLISVDGESEALASQCEHQVKPGERLRLMTPGGGGHGAR